MSIGVTVARPYAQAIFECARDGNAIAHWSDVLGVLSTAVSDASFSALLDNPKFAREHASSVLADVLRENLNDEGQRLLMMLSERRRLAILPDIAALFLEYVTKHASKVNAFITAAYEMSAAQKQAMEKVLHNKLQQDVNATYDTDASLIGGVIIRIGDRVIDGSVRGKLDKFKQQLQ